MMLYNGEYLMFDTVFISDPNFKYNQYLNFENLLLFFCVGVTISVTLILISELIPPKK